MIGQHLLAFRLKDTPLFKDVEFKIQKGLSVIYGLNRTNGRKSMQANGAGKSSLFSSVGETIYEEPIVGLKEDAVKQGTREVTLMVGKRKTVIRRKNSKLEILVDGKAKKFRKKSDGKLWIKEHLPLSQTEFNTYAYLDARVPHPLVMGTSSERKKFFNDAFGLDKIDAERKLYESELSKLKKVRIAYKELKQVFDVERETALSKEKREFLEQKLKALDAELEELNRKNQRLQEIAQVLAFEQSASKQVRKFEDVCPDLKEFGRVYEDARANLVEDRKKLKDAQRWADYQRDISKYTKALGRLSDEAQALMKAEGIKKALKACRNARDEYDDVKAKVEDCQECLDQEVKKPSKPEDDRPEQTSKELRALKESLEHKLEHAERFGKGVCDSCGQSVKVKDPAELKKKLKRVDRYLDLIEQWADYDEARAKYKEWKARAEEAEAALPKLQKQLKKLKALRKLGKELRDLPSEPEPFEGRKLEIGVMERMVEEDRERISLLEFMEPNLDTVKTLRGLTDKQRKASEIAPKLQQRINELHERCATIRAKLEQNEQNRDKLRKYRDRLIEMKAQLSEEEALKILVEAYSDKNMKRSAVKAISTRLMAEVNKYAKSIFPEDFEFDFVWESSKIQLLVHRRYRNGKKTKTITSDVRKLSGAESKLYTFILVLAHLTFVPSRKRSNVLILDEPDSNMSAETTEAFKRLLPILNQVIPSIIVITPRSNERYEGAKEFTVLKDKGVATIVEGHPSKHK